MKRVLVTVKTRSKRPGVLPMGDSWYLVSVAEAPVGGVANVAVTHALADHLGITPARLTLLRGARFHEKVFQIEEV